MTKVRTAKTRMKTRPIIPVTPTQQAFDRIVREHGLNESQAHNLLLVLKHFILDAQATLTYQDQLPQRSGSIERLKRMEKAVRRLHYEVTTSGEMMNYFLPHDLRQALGGSLTFTAISKAVGQDQFPQNFQFRAGGVAQRDGRLTMKGLEEEFRPQREALGSKFGHLLVHALINDLYQPLKKWVELNKLNKGGVQPHFLRNLIIERLAEASEDIIAKRATRTQGGKFVKLCASVLEALRLSDSGVEKAVSATLDRMKTKVADPTAAGGRK